MACYITGPDRPLPDCVLDKDCEEDAINCTHAEDVSSRDECIYWDEGNKGEEHTYSCPVCEEHYLGKLIKLKSDGTCIGCGKLILDMTGKPEDFVANALDAAYGTRGKILREALDIINGGRQDEYGDPEDSFKLIAGFWNTYLTRQVEGEGEPVVILDAKDVALMMTLFKIAREMHQGKRDNLVDAAGYLGIAGDMV